MSYTKRDVSFPSSDGKNTVRGIICIPSDKEICGIVMLAHGMIDHVERYGFLIDYLADNGIVFAGNDHLGHGKTVASPEDFGYFAHRDGYKYVISDLYRMNGILHEEFPSSPVILLGHSMGSFLSRLYAVEYPESIDALIIHGTGGKNPLLPMGKAIIALTRFFKGDKYRSKLVTGIAFGSYNKHFDKSEGKNAWLTRDLKTVENRETDPFTSYIFTAAGYADLFKVIGLSNSKKHFNAFPKELPTLVISGEDDPVGNYGRGVRFVYDSLKGAGVKNVSLKLYVGARHELFNEANRDEVFSDISGWLSEAGITK